jgi:nitrate/nitrite transport system substrate-binding protein
MGFIPLTDCASVVMAVVLGSTRSTALRSCPPRRPAGPACATSWSTASRTSPTCLCGLVYGVHLGVGGPKKDMAC